jgi:thiamine-phosphate pyrophosphorylase
VIRCYITDRKSLSNGTLLDAIARNLRAGIEWIQIREKDLSTRDLYELVEAAMKLPNPTHSKILVNTQVDVALAAGAHGVHLPSGSPPPRRFVPGSLICGVSCHTAAEAVTAEAEGASYVLFGPVYSPLSKHSAAPPAGLEVLERITRAAKIPVLALGGITAERIPLCIEAGASGIAGISLFQS